MRNSINNRMACPSPQFPRCLQFGIVTANMKVKTDQLKAFIDNLFQEQEKFNRFETLC